ncbi:replication initiation protein [Hugenholtzia roseola]|uniref:replication initiation protein n=1 Tax=Hugenholtzia roseola TaxID=1002 RepID=UPI0004069C02|nr:replication initiation protein [Hugenholtzia roseola]
MVSSLSVEGDLKRNSLQKAAKVVSKADGKSHRAAPKGRPRRRLPLENTLPQVSKTENMTAQKIEGKENAPQGQNPQRKKTTPANTENEEEPPHQRQHTKPSSEDTQTELVLPELALPAPAIATAVPKRRRKSSEPPKKRGRKPLPENLKKLAPPPTTVAKRGRRKKELLHNFQNYQHHPKHHLIVQHNDLINSCISEMSIFQKRFMYYVISLIDRYDADFQVYRIQALDIIKLAGISGKGWYQRMRSELRSLMGITIEIKKENGFLMMNWVSSIEYNKGFIEVSLDPKLKPYLLLLQERFTVFKLQHVFRMGSTHSMRLYELLKQYENFGERKFELPALRQALHIAPESYRNYNSLRTGVLERAQKDFEKCADLRFEIEEVKKGRKVAAVRFVIKRFKLDKSSQFKDAVSRSVVLLVAAGVRQDQALQFSNEDPDYIRFLQEKVRQITLKEQPKILLDFLEKQESRQDFEKEREKRKTQGQSFDFSVLGL